MNYGAKEKTKISEFGNALIIITYLLARTA